MPNPGQAFEVRFVEVGHPTPTSVPFWSGTAREKGPQIPLQQFFCRPTDYLLPNAAIHARKDKCNR